MIGTKLILKEHYLAYLVQNSKNESFRSDTGNYSHYSGDKSELSDQNTSGIIQIFTDRIREMIRKMKIDFYSRAWRKWIIFTKRRYRTKNAVENIFIYSLDYLTASCNKEYKRVIFAIFLRICKRYTSGRFTNRECNFIL